jgi:ABC-type branched-subunit amino acid transport system substrate-binding protein
VGALLVGLTLIAAACGDDEGSGDTTTATTAGGTTASTTGDTTGTTAMTGTTTGMTGTTTEMTGTTTGMTGTTTEMTGTTTGMTGTTTEMTGTTTGGTGAQGLGSCSGTIDTGGLEGEVVGETAPTLPEEEGGAQGALSGMKGTTPLVDLSDDFVERLNTCWTDLGNSELEDLNYGAESYDAVIVISLAAAIAETDGATMADEIVGVTKEGEKCTDYTGCLELVEAGTDIDYDGVSGPMEFNGNGEPLEASYGVLTFGDDNLLDDSLTEYVTAEADPSAEVELQTTSATREGDGTLKFGTLLPETGSLAFLGPPEFAGVELAIADVNAAGGVLGNDVEIVQGDSGDTSTDLASQTVDRLLGEDVDAIVGAASSGVSLTVVDKITGAGVVQFSPANTSEELSDYDDDALYFRNAPPDSLQGPTVANLVIEDGNASAYILALDDAYGTGLADAVEATLTEGGVEVVDKVIYDPKAASFDSEVGAIASADPDAIVLITFDEGSRILRAMDERGVGPTAKNVYGVDGNMGNALGTNFEGGT